MGAERLYNGRITLSLTLIILMLVSSISPMIANDGNTRSLEVRETFSNSVSFVNGTGEQFAGETIVINSTNWKYH